MCGIFFHISKETSFDKNAWQKTIKIITQRGPDSFNEKSIKFGEWHINLYTSVLHLQGVDIVVQPYFTESQDIFSWNGEVFGGITVGDEECDTKVIGDLLSASETDDKLLKIISKIHGPWAFIFLQRSKKKIWFGRDYFGRRSLLYTTPTQDSFVFASAGNRDESDLWTEVPAIGVFSIDLNQSSDIGKCIECYPWASVTNNKKLKMECNIDFKNFDYCCFKGNVISAAISEVNDGSYEVAEKLVITNNIESMNELIIQNELQSLATKFLQVLKDAVKKRVQNVPCRQLNKTGAPVGVLFSGGIDCTVLAALTASYVEEGRPIDLINVAFENPKCVNYEVPDRITGCKAVSILRKLYPNRQWNFIEVNVTKTELSEKRNESIVHLINPLTTVLDDSIGCAVWFASGGQGYVGEELYQCQSKVLICGMGADEQLAGYSRHRSAFEKGGFGTLSEEIKLEIERISSRNLGRDDRIISDFGREARFPYLDENVVSFLNTTSVHHKADLRYPRGIGEKILLRAVATQLGLEEVATFPKRAIQFGSRIAKAEGKREKASDVCKRLIKT